MKGRSRVTFRTTTGAAFKGVEYQTEEEEITRLKLLNQIAADHNVLSNKLKSIGKRMVTNARHKDEAGKVADNSKFNKLTLHKYQKIAERAGRKQDLSEPQRKQIIDNWFKKRKCKVKTQLSSPKL